MFFCKLFRMADDDLPPNSYGNGLRTNEPEPDVPQHLGLDLGDDSSRNPDINRLGNPSNLASGSNSHETQRREDNPFSFKHFLRSDSSNTSYQGKGARPKVYCEGRPAHAMPELGGHVPESKQSSRIVPEYSSALPDFVQDHLVIEQCYLGSSGNSYDLDMDNLPDFTPSREGRAKFDGSGNSRDAGCKTTKPIPLDLPLRPQGSFPLDLPIGGSSAGSRNAPTNSEVGNSKSLPDFLADSVSQERETLSVPHSPETGGSEADALRRELDLARRQLAERARQCEGLVGELEAARRKEREYTRNLSEALARVEDGLAKSNRRAAAAESSVLKLKQEVKLLMTQIGNLKLENQSLRGEEAAGGGNYYNPSNEMQSHRLAQELRTAASTAEHSLRQLLTGVDNLRIMAASLENMHRIEEKSDPFSNFEEDSGPAL